MKSVNEIYSDYLLGKVRFHRAIETDMFRDALMFYMDRKFSTCASLCSTLYEMIFTTRLVRESANPKGFVPGKHNIEEQLKNLMDREDQIINQDKLSFRKITSELAQEGVITSREKEEYDSFYTTIRNPVAHGLTFRLYEPMLGKKPAHSFEVETNYQPVYEKASEMLLNSIYALMYSKKLLKQ
tara:strand:- start:508 stop:1059 length:552 start_codon:yes stop_codon:yes gene_type:complete